MSFGFVNGSVELDVIDLKDDAPSVKVKGSNNVVPVNHHASDFSASSHGSSKQKTPSPLMVTSSLQKEPLLSGIFSLDDDKSYDVTLYSSLIVLTIIGGKIKCKLRMLYVAVYNLLSFHWDLSISTYH